MDPQRIEFVFGRHVDPHEYDLHDESVLFELFDGSTLLSDTGDDEGSGSEAMRRAVHVMIANQVLQDDPPETWATVQRLAEAGLDRGRILRQLTMLNMEEVARLLEERTPFDPDAYVTKLAQLPLPDADDIEAALRRIVRDEPGVDLDAAIAATVAELGWGDHGSGLVEELVDRVVDHLLDVGGSIALLARDRLVDLESLLGGKVLTHRLSDAEVSTGTLDGRFDLWVHRSHDDPHLPDGTELHVIDDGRGHLAWHSPTWLDGYREGSLIAVRVDADGTVQLTALDDEPPVDPDVVSTLRRAYEDDAEAGLPVSAEELLATALLEDPTLFDEPCAPLTELAEAAGLEVRGNEAAHDDSVWRTAASAGRMIRLLHRFGADEDDLASAALDVVHLAERCEAEAHGRTDEAEHLGEVPTFAEAFSALEDPAVLHAVAEELFDPPGRYPALDAEPFVTAALDAASRRDQTAVASWLRCLLAERRDDLDEAERALEAAVAADPEFAPAIDRLAWYASDRGDAPKAARLWRMLSGETVAQDLANVEAAIGPARSLGRNERCWCGSGRKYKHCHLGRSELPPLPERVGWVARKAVAFLERWGDSAEAAVFQMAVARAVHPDDARSLSAAFEDPLVIDLVLTEGGWFEAFLERRGPLLPEDEQLLAASWVLVPRTVYEVDAVEPGRSVLVRDLRTGERTEVTERTFSREARTGTLVCARAVPDGPGHQFVGAIFGVPPGREGGLLELLDEANADGDGTAVAEWVAQLERPPRLVDAEGGTILDLGALSPAELDELRRRGEQVAALDEDDPQIRAVLVERRNQLEEQWCDESVPALGGLTPRQAAADPTRRDELRRLLNSFDALATDGPGMMRPDRLRELLELD